MSERVEGAGAAVELPETDVIERPTERLVMGLLDQRYTRRGSMGPERYIRARHVRDSASWARRVCDYMAMDTYQITDGDWSAPKYALHGHEVKVSRSDWLAELRDPTKAEAFRPYCTHWWLAVSDKTIVRDDLPEGWGLLVVQGSRLVAKVRPMIIEPEPMPRALLAGLLRAATKQVSRPGHPAQPTAAPSAAGGADGGAGRG